MPIQKHLKDHSAFEPDAIEASRCAGWGSYATSSRRPASKPSSLLAAPECTACGHLMRLVLIEPHEHFSNLDNRHFVCSCGATADYVVTHSELARTVQF